MGTFPSAPEPKIGRFDLNKQKPTGSCVVAGHLGSGSASSIRMLSYYINDPQHHPMSFRLKTQITQPTESFCEPPGFLLRERLVKSPLSQSITQKRAEFNHETERFIQHFLPMVDVDTRVPRWTFMPIADPVRLEFLRTRPPTPRVRSEMLVAAGEFGTNVVLTDHGLALIDINYRMHDGGRTGPPTPLFQSDFISLRENLWLWLEGWDLSTWYGTTMPLVIPGRLPGGPDESIELQATINLQYFKNWDGRWEFKASEFEKLFVFGDIHGDFALLETCLMKTECLHGFSWRPDRRGIALIFLGDLVDRDRRPITKYTLGGMGLGEFNGDEHAILLVLNHLAVEAERHGSAVFRMVGNHEFMGGVNGTPMSIALENRADSFSRGDFFHEIRACHPRAILKIGGYLFMHGGLNTRLLDIMTSLQDDPYFTNAKRTRANFLDVANITLNKNLFDGDSKYFYILDNGGERRDAKGLFKGDYADLVPGLLWDDELSNDRDPAGVAIVRKMYKEWGELPKVLTEDSKVEIARRMNVYVTDVIAKANLNLQDTNEPVTRMVVAHCQQNWSKNIPSAKMYFAMETPLDFVWSPVQYDNFEDEFTYTPGMALLHEGRVWCTDISASRAFRWFDGVDDAKAPRLKKDGDETERRIHFLRSSAPAALFITPSDDTQTMVIVSKTPLGNELRALDPPVHPRKDGDDPMVL